jgi:hypothetical protein
MVELVQVPRSAFAFCRWSLTALLWWAFLARQAWPVAAVAAILAMAALLKVHRSPMVLLWSWTALRIRAPRHYDFLDVGAMRFAHAAGTVLALAVLLALHLAPRGGRGFLLFYCCLKTVSALGFCPASKLFTCLRKGGCCALKGGSC